VSAEPTGQSARGGHAGRVSTGLILALAVVSVVLVGLDLVVERHPHFEPDRWPGFYALCGAASCIAAVGVALLLRRIVLRREGYHDR
jgi:hypothetical protein